MAPPASVKTFHEIPALFGQPIPKKQKRRVIRDLDQFLRIRDAEPWRDILRRDPCAYCGVVPGRTVDHIEAVSTGGRNNASNLTGACKRCNSHKGSLSLLVALHRRTRQKAEAQPAAETKWQLQWRRWLAHTDFSQIGASA